MLSQMCVCKMKYITADKQDCCKHISLWYHPNETLTSPAVPERFRLILVSAGTGIVRLGDKRMMFMAPALFCLNETETIHIEQSNDFKASSLYFHPKLINSNFDFESIRQSGNLPGTAQMDRGWLKPFIHRSPNYFGYLSIGPAGFRKLSGLIDSVQQELSEQSDNYWRCRSRSYFLEVLMLGEHLFRNPNENVVTDLQETPDEVDQVILYLHTNYVKKLTIPELTRMFKVNRTTLAERFSAVTGESVMSYLNQLRIRLAAGMLRDTMLPVAEITERVGFGDVTHFGRMFRKTTNLSPSEYREKYCFMIKR